MTQEELKAAQASESFLLKWGQLLPKDRISEFASGLLELANLTTRAGMAIQDESYKDAFRKLGATV